MKGNIPADICPIFYGAKTFGLSKKDGGVRPISVGCTLRRLAAKLCMAKIKDDCKVKFLPHQLGVGVPSGAESSIHSCRKYVKNNHSSPKVLLKVDFKNAFNTIRRDVVLNNLKSNYPKLYPFVWQCYSLESNLYFGSDIIISATGVQQGDAIGGLLFALGINPLISKLRSELNSWYLDDGMIADSPETVLDDFKYIIHEGEKLGLVLNPSKCEIFTINCQENAPDIISKFKETAPEIKVIDTTDLILLGAPILPESYDTILNSKHADLKRMLARLDTIDCHDAYFLLKNCFAIPKLLFFLRSAPLFESNQLADMDRSLRTGLEHILNVDLSSNIWKQASLPVKMGGLGIRSFMDLATPAFISSYYKSKEIIDIISPDCIKNMPYTEVEKAERKWANMPGITEEDYPNDTSVQKNWDLPLCKLTFKTLIDHAKDETTSARLLAITQEHASDWLEALPSASLGLKLENQQFRIACALRLGSKVCHTHTCVCGKLVSSNGYHGLSCKKSSGRHPRHSHINDLIKRACISGGTSAIREPQGISRTDGKRPDGMSMFPWKNGKLLLWDFTCVDTLAPSHVLDSSKFPGKAANEAELRKIKHYDNLTESYHFIPICMETFGTFGQIGISFIKDLGEKIISQTGEKRSTAFLFQSIGIAMQRGNAFSILGTLKQDDEHLHEIYLL